MNRINWGVLRLYQCQAKDMLHLFTNPANWLLISMQLYYSYNAILTTCCCFRSTNAAELWLHQALQCTQLQAQYVIFLIRQCRQLHQQPDSHQLVSNWYWNENSRRQSGNGRYHGSNDYSETQILLCFNLMLNSILNSLPVPASCNYCHFSHESVFST